MSKIHLFSCLMALLPIFLHGAEPDAPAAAQWLNLKQYAQTKQGLAMESFACDLVSGRAFAIVKQGANSALMATTATFVVKAGKAEVKLDPKGKIILANRERGEILDVGVNPTDSTVLYLTAAGLFTCDMSGAGDHLVAAMPPGYSIPNNNLIEKPHFTVFPAAGLARIVACRDNRVRPFWVTLKDGRCREEPSPANGGTWDGYVMNGKLVLCNNDRNNGKLTCQIYSGEPWKLEQEQTITIINDFKSGRIDYYSLYWDDPGATLFALTFQAGLPHKILTINLNKGEPEEICTFASPLADRLRRGYSMCTASIYYLYRADDGSQAMRVLLSIIKNAGVHPTPEFFPYDVELKAGATPRPVKSKKLRG